MSSIRSLFLVATEATLDLLPSVIDARKVSTKPGAPIAGLLTVHAREVVKVRLEAELTHAHEVLNAVSVGAEKSFHRQLVDVLDRECRRRLPHTKAGASRVLADKVESASGDTQGQSARQVLPVAVSQDRKFPGLLAVPWHSGPPPVNSIVELFLPSFLTQACVKLDSARLRELACLLHKDRSILPF